MSEIDKARKADLYQVALEMDLDVDPSMKVVKLREMIKSSPQYEVEFVNSLVRNQIAVREEEQHKQQKALELEEKRRAEELELEKRKLEMNFELEKLKLQAQTQVESSGLSSNNVARPSSCAETKIDVQKLLPTFKAETDDITLFLVLLERQLKLLKVPEHLWVSHLLSVVPNSISLLIARESEENSSNFAFVKDLLLKRFKVSAERFRQLFFTHKKLRESTWRDYYFELRAYFENWLKELEINSFEALQDLFIADVMKRRVPFECKEHLLDEWESLNSPSSLAERLDAYDNSRSMHVKKEVSGTVNKKEVPKKEYFKQPVKTPYAHRPHESPPVTSNQHRESTIVCYGCGKPGFIKKKCPNCSSSVKKENVDARNLKLYSCNSSPVSSPNVPITICNKKVLVCADTGASHSIAGERLYKLFQKTGVSLKSYARNMTLADGVTRCRETLSATVPVDIEGRVFKTEFIILPNATGNRTLLGMDFLQKAKLVLDAASETWYFSDQPQQKYPLIKDLDSKGSIPVATVEVSPYALREDEGRDLTLKQKNELNALLEKYEKCFQPGGEPTPFIEHRINTKDHPPVAVPPYRMTPAKKELLKKEIDRLLSEGIIEECESPYASPVVLVPKPNGSVRLCIDYRKLNEITVNDSYPLPRMDDLLHEAKPTPFMSTIDLRAGYHQVKVHPEDQDKTAFVCPFGTYRFLRMPYGLKNGPPTFQRLMNRFCNGLEDILALPYIDDLIILSETFEKHILDLKAVFERLLLFKLKANREKCHFASSRVKYLGFWITQKGIEVDPEKVASILEIPSPTNVKQVQSFLQTCSWFRRYIPDFAKISRPLSNLTKKKAQWEWGFEQQNAFETLKKCLTTPPVLKQADGSQPYILRTDASNYALGAVLLQGEGSNEHPIEYASRLLTSSERNYSTTEREALAVVWALKKFRGYIEGAEITVASDHQPLKWLLNLKSPSGRLARWALEIQSFNLKIQYIPGKANVIADMLSRPICREEASCCEVNNISIADMPTRSCKDMREAQLKDENLKKIIESFETPQKTEEYANWTERGFLMNQGVLYRYVPDADSEDAQLVIPSAERELIMQRHHNDPMAGHYGVEGTFQKIARRYYWTGMKKYISDYIKNCPECNRFKATNQKPAGLLRTPVFSQRFEVLAIDLFGPLPPTETGQQWIFIVEDCATKWVELFPLSQATARHCATTLIEEIFMRYGIPRRIISDNGPQFVSAVLQQVCYTLNINQNLIPVYSPQCNPVERKNRDLKPRLAILVGDDHANWYSKLPVIRFAMNTTVCDTTGHTPAYLQFGRELRTVDDVVHDFKGIVENDNFVPEITPYLKRLANITKDIRDRVEKKQDQRKKYFDKNRKPLYFSPGEKVWVNLHPVSKAGNKKTAKFMPKRDGPYIILTQRSPTTYEVASTDKPDESLGTYHISALAPFRDVQTEPVAPLRRRGRPRKSNAVPSSGRVRGNRGGDCNTRNTK